MDRLQRHELTLSGARREADRALSRSPRLSGDESNERIKRHSRARLEAPADPLENRRRAAGGVLDCGGLPCLARPSANRRTGECSCLCDTGTETFIFEEDSVRSTIFRRSRSARGAVDLDAAGTGTDSGGKQVFPYGWGNDCISGCGRQTPAVSYKGTHDASRASADR